MANGVARQVVAACPVTAWHGVVWRIHARRYAPDDVGGALIVSGRYHRGRDFFPQKQVFAALYTSAGADVATWEMLRHSKRETASAMWARFTSVVLSRLLLDAEALLDLRDPSPAVIGRGSLLGDDYALTQAIGAAAVAEGLEGLLVPSATGVGAPGADFNVVVFPAALRARSSIAVLDTRRPKLPS